jgi:hypothetical protein
LVELIDEVLVDMLLIIALKLLEELFGIVEKLYPCSVHPVLFLLDGAFNLPHDDVSSSAFDDVFEHDHTTSQHN